MRSRVIVSRRFAVVFSLSLIFGLSDVGAQERFFTSPSRGGADGAREKVQLQQETNRGIAHQVSITAIEGNVGNLQSRMGTAETNIGNLTTRVGTAESNITTLQSEMANVKPHATTIMPGTCSQAGAKLRWNTTSSDWECVAEGDPTVRNFAKNDLPTCAGGEVLRSNGVGFSCVVASTSATIIETDPKIGATTSNLFCRGTGSQVTCDQAVPTVTESDPQVGAVASGQWCRGDGESVQCDQNAPSSGAPGNVIISSSVISFRNDLNIAIPQIRNGYK
jgi:hypothetical protein